MHLKQGMFTKGTILRVPISRTWLRERRLPQSRNLKVISQGTEPQPGLQLARLPTLRATSVLSLVRFLGALFGVLIALEFLTWKDADRALLSD